MKFILQKFTLKLPKLTPFWRRSCKIFREKQYIGLVYRHTVIPGLWTQELDAGLWTLNSELWTLDSERWKLYCGPWALDARLWMLKFKILYCPKFWKQSTYIDKFILEFSIEANLWPFQVWKFIYRKPIWGQCSVSNHLKYHADCSWLNLGVRGAQLTSQLSWVPDYLPNVSAQSS